MSQPTSGPPLDPQSPPLPPWQGPPLPPQQHQPFPPYGYYPAPGFDPQAGAQQPHGRVVTRSGITSTGHIVHAVLTLCTGFLWAPVWLIHWLLTRNKRTTTY